MRRYIQLGVIVAVLAIGGGLLANAMIQARAAANRAKCANNLKQLGLDCHNYASTYRGKLPPAALANDELVPERRLSCIYLILPFVEADPTFRLIDPKENWDSPRNWAHITKYGRPFRCPSHPSDDDLPYYTHYVGVAGVGEDAAHLPLDDPRAGVSGYDRQVTLEEVKRQDATLLFIETARDNGPWAAGGPPTVRGLVPGTPYLGRDGQFTSGHPGVVPAAFVDGSVRALETSLDPHVFETFATINNQSP
jgi:hypothetical protein